MTTSEAIVKFRNKLTLSQAELAVALGIGARSVSRYENGREPNAEVLDRLSGLARKAELKRFDDLFQAKRRSDIANQIETLPSSGTARRVSFQDLGSWAAKAKEIKAFNQSGLDLVEHLKILDLSNSLEAIVESFRMGVTAAKELSEDIGIYLAS